MKQQYINNLLVYLKQFENKTVESLFDELNINSKAKSKNFILSKALMASFEGKEIAEAKIAKFKLNIKTIQLRAHGFPKESMSFSPINFLKIIEEDWMKSDFRNYLAQDFIFFVFKIMEGTNVLFRVIHWVMPLSDLDGETRLVWEDTKKKIKEGTIIKEKKEEKIITWFLAEKVTNICHVRPHGANGADITKLPVQDKLTGYSHVLKYSFWFNHSYLKAIVDGS